MTEKTLRTLANYLPQPQEPAVLISCPPSREHGLWIGLWNFKNRCEFLNFCGANFGIADLPLPNPEMKQVEQVAFLDWENVPDDLIDCDDISEEFWS